MANLSKGEFGAAPAIENEKLPKVASIKDDAKLGTALGTIGGRVQWTLNSTMFFFGRMARDGNVKGYTGEKLYEAYYAAFYADGKGLADASKTQQRVAVCRYAEIAQLPWDARGTAQLICETQGLSEPQKGTLIKKVCEKHAKDAPSGDDVAGYIASALGTGGSGSKPTIKGKAAAQLKAFKDIRDHKDYKSMWKVVNGDKELLGLFNAAVTALDAFAARAKAVVEEKTPAKPRARRTTAAPDKAALAAARSALASAQPTGKPN